MARALFIALESLELTEILLLQFPSSPLRAEALDQAAELGRLLLLLSREATELHLKIRRIR